MTTVTDLAMMARRGAQRNMTSALMQPVLAQTLERAASASRLNEFHRVLYEPFERARALDATLNFRDFVLSGPPQQRELLHRLLGPDGYTLATELSGTAYFEARLRVLRNARTPTGRTPNGPIPHFLSWGHWSAQPPVIDVAGRTRLVPVDFPIERGRRSNIWVYPTWNQGRPRLMQNLGYIELNARLGGRVEVPTAGGGPALLTALNLPHDPTPRRVPDVNGLRMSDLQVARWYLTGDNPIYDMRILPSGSSAPEGFILSESLGARGPTEARWELASRLRDPNLVLSSYFQSKIGSYSAAADVTVPGIVNPNYPLSGLSNADLVRIARRDVGCLEVAIQVYEVEHRRAQRAVRELTEVLAALEDVTDTSLIAHLCGLCDPHNLVILTPEGHAAVDFHAFYVQTMGQWSVNTARVRGGAIPASFDAHQGFARSVNAFVEYSPYQLQPVAALLRELSVMQAVQRSSPEVIDAYNHLAATVAAAMRSYEMDMSLMPMLFTHGGWK